ncbi:flagellar brake domain-containing protein [Paenibacillus profundus]|uniref:Flagellar brake domain-containing protein n=1 Tax=Paenibacillus profundus TaxID=1173085 RepID=A0ABS8YC45_9BACL|nr:MULTISPECIES: flagellar brake domain-containing protein [Paenibacillus]MCE5169586.1 flagellar brake domain-containing protein [Paenibacillus profundus]MCM3341366.1 flagellar brake domain-containing protein [Paenibacillus sp. MER TA 81-3]
MLPNINDMMYMQSVRAQAGDPTYKSRVTEIDEEHLWIEIPLCEQTGKYGVFAAGEELDVYYSQEDGMKWHFRTLVTGRRQDTIRMLSIRKPEQHWLTRMQRRNYLRVQANLETAISTMDGVKFIALSEDISGGGMSFVTHPKWGLRETQLLQCWIAVSFRSGAIEHVPFTGQIVRIQPIHEERVAVMVKFEQISEVEQQKLIRYCFERQFELRK